VLDGAMLHDAMIVYQIKFFFKLEEEESTALLLHLPVLYAESAVFWSASGLGCILVVAIAQAFYSCFCDWVRLLTS
jgi:hypothetical protein